MDSHYKIKIFVSDNLPRYAAISWSNFGYASSSVFSNADILKSSECNYEKWFWIGRESGFKTVHFDRVSCKIVLNQAGSEENSTFEIFSLLFFQISILISFIIAKSTYPFQRSLYKIHSSCFSLFVNEIESSLNDSSVNREIILANQMAQIWTMTHREAKRVIHLHEKCLMKWSQRGKGFTANKLNYMTHQYDSFIWIVQWGRSKFQVRKLNWASSAWFAVWSSPSNWESCHACFTPAIYSWDGCQFHSENIWSVANRQFAGLDLLEFSKDLVHEAILSF